MFHLRTLLSPRTAFTRQAHSKPGVLHLWHELLQPRSVARAMDDPMPQSLGAASEWVEADALLKDQLRAFQGHVEGALLPEQVHLGLIRFYQNLNHEQRAPFLRLLTDRLGVQEGDINAAIGQWQQVLGRSGGSGGSGGHREAVQRAADRLRAAAQPLYRQLFGPISREPEGIPFLVSMRAHVREALDSHPAAGASLRGLDAQLKQALSSWFSPGLLECRQITWQSSPAALLEKLMQYEAVHPVQGWEDLKQRLGPCRRVHAYFHPCLPGEPLVILHAALMTHVPTCMDQVLLLPTQTQAPGPPSRTQPPLTASPPPSPTNQPTVATFYSISSTQPGLAGVDLGHFLIIHVAKKIQAELPGIQHLVTLSPIPGFRAWLQAKLAALALEQTPSSSSSCSTPQSAGPASDVSPDVKSDHPTHASAAGNVGPVQTTVASSQQGSQLASAAGQSQGAARRQAGADEQPQEVAGQLPRAVRDPVFVGILPGTQPLPLLIQPEEEAQLLEAGGKLLSADNLPKLESAGGSAAACLALILEDGTWHSRGKTDPALHDMLERLLLRAAARYLLLERRRSLALDAVAHFHLRNGAQLLRINPGADMSEGGLRRSYGLMVNYQYDLTRADSNNRAYLVEHSIQACTQVMDLLKA